VTDPLAPPPPEPLDPAARARLRARVLTDVDTVPPTSRGRWAVPVAAAAAVAVVATMAAVVGLSSPGDRTQEAPLGGAVPSTASASPATDPATTPSASTTSLPVLPDEGGVATSEPGTLLPGSGASAPEDCAGELRFVLRGAEPVVELAGEASTATFVVKGDRWAQCTVGPEAVTVAGDREVTATYARDDATPWQVSSDISDFRRSSMTLLFVAGGPLPEGVTAITYRFPGGAVEEAVTATDDQGRTWWRMEHVATDGVLADPGRNQLELDPIEVTIVSGGGTDTVLLDWGTDTCAQLNHGC
jgi:hypothetical protein